MGFAIRLVAIAADGREIVRDTTVDGDTLSIGRGTDNQLVLADLAAAPSHLRLIDAGDRLVIEMLADEPVVIDGRVRRRCEVRLARPAVLRLGAHRLTLARAADGAVAITVRREAAAGAADEARAFSLAGRLPGKRKTAWAAVLALLLLFVAWPIWSFEHRTIATGADASWSAGPLSPAHAALSNNCKACHVGAFAAVSDTVCASCHTSVHAHADPARLAAARASLTGWATLRQRVATALGKPAGRCADCHVEHRGAAGMAVADQRFCSDCHAALTRRLPDTRLGDAADFAALHPQFSPAVIASAETGATRRVSLDLHPHEANGLTFSHAQHLAPDGGVARMALTTGQGRLDCAGCHRADPDGRGFAPVSMTRDCAGCHSLAYARVGSTFLTLPHGDTAQVIALLTRSGGAGAVRAAFGKGGLCADCHRVRPQGAGWQVVPVRQPARYLLNGWFDHASHQDTPCAGCHAAAGSRQASDVLIPGIATCRNCHGGEHAQAPLVRSTCIQCHGYHPSALAPRAARRWRDGDAIAAAPLRPDWAS